MRAVFTALLCAAVAAPLPAQDTAIVINPESTGVHFLPPELPRAVVDAALRIYNGPATSRLVGRTELPAGARWAGDVAVRNGPVILAGRIEGSLLVVNGDLLLRPGAAVTGDVLVVGGGIAGRDSAAIGGRVAAFREPLPYRIAGDTLAYAPNLRKRFEHLGAEYVLATEETRSALTLSTGGTFNRVEGLPIVFGPVFQWHPDSIWQFRLDALGVLRTAGDLTGQASDLGYRLRAEARRATRGRSLALSARAFSVVAPVEDWGLTAAEVGWAAFLFQRDYRDYYFSQGAAIRLAAQPAPPLTASVEWRRDAERGVTARDPWTVFRNDRAWRPNPPIDEGHYTTWQFALALDTRNDADDPTSGWLARASVDLGSSRDVTPQAALPADVRRPIPTDGSYAYSKLWIDLRRYTRLSGAGRVDLRMLAGGWLGGDPLPLQQRLSLGGGDPLPGYPFRFSACNRDIVAPALADARVAACDRVLLFQGEYRGHVSLRWAYPQSGESTTGLLFRLVGPDVVVFGDAGQAWLVGNGPGRIPSGRLPDVGSWIADLGLGVDWGGFGVYAAKAVTAGQPIRFVLRLDHRF